MMTKPKPKVQVTAKPPAATEPDGLVGRYFHIFGDDRRVQYQGRVVKQIDPTHYLVQFYEFFAGDPNTLHVVTIDQMSTSKIISGRGVNTWQFYQDHQHWIDWYESHESRHDRAAE